MYVFECFNAILPFFNTNFSFINLPPSNLIQSYFSFTNPGLFDPIYYHPYYN